jgi:ankyrin repeat protein/S-adenosylhomocysteine hydrolase
LNEKNTADNSGKSSIQTPSIQLASIPNVTNEQQPDITLDQEAVIPSVEGYYSGEDIDLLIRALLKEHNFVIEKDYLVSVSYGMKLSTYVLPATSKDEGLGHLGQLIESLASGQTHTCQVLIPYKVSRFEHWVSILVYYQDNQFTVTVYDSLANAKTADETIDEIINFTKSLTKANVIKHPLQKPVKIQDGNVYCGGYTAHVIADAVMEPLEKPDALSNLICIDEFLLDLNDDINRANDARIVGTQKPEGYRRYALKGDGHQSPENKTQSEQHEKEVHHHCGEEFTRRYNNLSQANQHHLSEKLHNERNNLVNQLNATKESHKVAIDVLSSYRNYCRDDLNITIDENPFTIFFKPKMDFQSIEINEEMTSLDVFIKEKLFTFDSNHPELSIQALELAKVNSDAREIIGKDDIKAQYYQRLAKAAAGTGEGANEVWDFIKHLDALESDIFYRPLILELQEFITIHDKKSNSRYLALPGFLKEDKFFNFLTNSKNLAQASAIKIKKTCDHFLQSKVDSINQQQVDYVLSNVMRWFMQIAFTKNIETNYYRSPLLYAATKGQLEVVQWLLQEGGAVITEKNKYGDTALILAASSGWLDMVQWLFPLLQEVWATNYWGNKVLLTAAENGHLAIVQWALQKGGAKITERGIFGQTALLLAAWKGRLGVVQWLLQKGGAAITDRNNMGDTALVRAAEFNRFEVVQWLLQEGGATITEKNRDGDTAWLHAARYSTLEEMQWLLREVGATITEKNNDGETALVLAAQHGKLDMVEWFIVECGFIFTNEEIDLALEKSSYGVELWLNLYKFLSTNPSPYLTKCSPFDQIVAYAGKDKTHLLDKSLSLLFSLFESPQKKALGLALYQLHEQELQPLLCESQQQIIKLVLNEKNTADNSGKSSIQTPSIQLASIPNVTNEQQPDITLDQEAVIPSVEGYYSGEDIDLLIKALLKEHNFVIEKDYLVSVSYGMKLSTYVLPATSKDEGLGHLGQVIESLAGGQTHTCQVLIPYKVSRFEHWVSILVYYQNNQFTLTVYDSLANVKTVDETIDEIVNFMKSLTKANVIKHPLQKPVKIQDGNVYCGGYTAHVIADAVMEPLEKPDALSNLICIDEFLLDLNDDINRANDARIVGTQKPEGYRRYALKGDGHQSPENKTQSEQHEKEVHHHCGKEFTRRFNNLSQANQHHLSEKLHNERNNLVNQLNATKESHKVAIDVLSSYRNYCRDELNIAIDENPFAIFFKPKTDLQSIEIDKDFTSLDVFIKEKLVTFESNHLELLDLTKVNSDAEEIIGNDNSDASVKSQYYQRIAKAMAGTGEDTKEVWDFIKHSDAQENAIFYPPLILELQNFITIYDENPNNRYLAMHGALKEDKLFHCLNNSKILTQASVFQIKTTCDRFLQAKLDSVNQQNVGYVLSEVIQWLLKKGFTKIAEKNGFGERVLLLAAWNGQLNIVKWLLRESGATTAEKYIWSRAALLYAIERGPLELVQFLLKEGWVTITEKNSAGTTALLYAAEFGNLEVVQWLLQEGGATITETDDSGSTALLCAVQRNQLNVVQWLLQEGGAQITEKNNYGQTALLRAIHWARLNMVQWLLQEGGATITEKDRYGTTALLLAVLENKLEVVQWLLQEGGATITETSKWGNTVLLCAAEFGKLDVVQWLLQEGGATITEKNNDGNTALLCAAVNGRLDVVQWLLLEGGSTIFEKNNHGNTVLLSAAESGHLDVVQWLLRECGATIAEKNNDGNTVLLLAASAGRLDVVQWLLQKGRATITEKNINGQTVLLCAAVFGNLDVVQWLLQENGATITDMSNDGNTALLCAAKHGMLPVVRWLLQEGGATITEKDNNNFTALLVATYWGRFDVVKWLLQEGGAKITENRFGITALLLAAALGKLDIVQWLLQEGGATITEKNDDGNTALLCAAGCETLPVVRWLLQAGQATITEKNNDGDTALLVAASRGWLSIVQWLLMEGGFIFSNEEIDLALSKSRNKHKDNVSLWLDFYNFLSMNPSPPLTECMPLTQILAFTGKEKDKALLLDKSLSLLFSLFESPQKKALGMALYQLNEQELHPLLSENQQQIIERMSGEISTAHDSHDGATQASLIQLASTATVSNASQPAIVLDQEATSNQDNEKSKSSNEPTLLNLSEDEKQIIKVILEKITTSDLFIFALRDAFNDKFKIKISYQEKVVLPGNFTQKMREADNFLYENIMLNTCVKMYKLMHKCQPSLLPSFIDRITTDLRGNKKPTVFNNELNHWREHPNAAEDDQASVFQDALVNLLKSKDLIHQDYKLLFEWSKKELQSSNKKLFITARESIEENVLDVFKARAPSVVYSWIAEWSKEDLKCLLLDPALTLRASLFSKRREAFVKRHPCGPDDSKVPTYYKNVIEQFEFNKNTHNKIAFIVVAHFVHTLPYFLEAMSSMGDVVALISKQSGTVKSVRKSILDIYKDIIVPNLDKNNLKKNSTHAESFFTELFENETWQNHKFIIFDHGGYFAPRIDDVLKKHKHKIIGVVEHTWNGEVRYQEQLELYHSFPFPILSVAHSTLKGLESEAVANSLVDALSGKIFTGEGISQTINTLQRILIIGYGHIGKAVATVLKNKLGNRGKEVICICDLSDKTRKEAKREFSHVTKDKGKYLKDADLIITATSTLALTKKDFAKLKAGAFIACATSSDDQFTEEAIKEYVIEEGQTKQIQSLCPKYKHKNSEQFFYLIANGDSVNFTIGSTPHPIIHIVLTSICVDAHELIKNNSATSWDLKQINLFNGQDELIKKIYEGIFGRIVSDDNLFTNRIQAQSIALLEKMDNLKPHKNYIKNYIPAPIKMANNKYDNSDALVPMVFDQTIQNIYLYGSGKTFLLQYFMRLWSQNTGFQKEVPYVFYIKRSLFKDALFKQYRIDSTELMDLTQVLLLLKGIQEGRSLSAKSISNSSTWYELFSYELDNHPERFCFFIDNSDIPLKDNKAYKTIGQIVEKLMKGQPLCKVVIASGMPLPTRFFADKNLEVVRLLPWSPELLQRSALVNINLLKLLDTFWLFNSTVHNLKVVKRQFKFLSNKDQLMPVTMSLTEQTQMIEEIRWTQYFQSKYALQQMRKYINDSWNGFYKKSQNEFNEKSLSTIRSYFPDEFHFLKRLAISMINKNVSNLNRDDCEELWLEANESKKSKQSNQPLKNKLQAEYLLQTLIRAGFLCTSNSDNYQFSDQWLPYYYAVGWVEKFCVQETKKEISKYILTNNYVEQYIVGMLSQKKDASKLLNDFSTYFQDGNLVNNLVEAGPSLQHLKDGYTKKIIRLAKTEFFHKSEKKTDRENSSTDKLLSNPDKTSKLGSYKATDKTKHGKNKETLFQSKNKDSNKKKEEEKLDNRNKKTEQLTI